MTLPVLPTTFKQRVEEGLAQPDRLHAVASGTETTHNKRTLVLETLPDPDATRDLGRQIRAHTIAHLDTYLTPLST